MANKESGSRRAPRFGLSLARPITSHLHRIALKIVLIVAVVTIGGSARGDPTSFQADLDRAGVAYLIPELGKAIPVNIPAFELIAFQDGEHVLRSRVIVGAPWHPTPRLQTQVSTVRFRPTWRPTRSMIASGEYADYVRPAGADNPLGLAAVRLGPGLLIYLHDTNQRALFAEENRALSHGCVRVENWDTLVAFVLDMELTQVHQFANGTRTFDMPATPIPVTLGYFTGFPDQTGQIVTHPDIYGLNAATTRSEPSSAKANATCTIVRPVE